MIKRVSYQLTILIPPNINIFKYIRILLFIYKHVNNS